MASDARLFVLATIGRLGEAHGHEVAREAAADQMESWAHVSAGALYSALRRCETDGLVEAVRTEQVGRFPARTVYRLTTEGEQALDRARAEAWARTGLSPDPFDVALSISDGCDPGVLRPVIERRLGEYESALSALRGQAAQMRGRLEPTAVAVLDHVVLRHETEVAWHRQLLARVDTFATRRDPVPTGTASARP